MGKPLAASKQLMQNYLSELLTEDKPAPENKPAAKPKSVSASKVIDKETSLNKMLQKVSVAEQQQSVADSAVTSRKALAQAKTVKTTISDNAVVPTEPVAKTEIDQQSSEKLITAKSKGDIKVTADAAYREHSFQAMFFSVAGLTIAVPLIELGGIHNVEKTNSLMGKPDWFEGVMLHREEKINVVDTAMWVMPEKCDETLKSSLNYQYVIMLNNSRWGLMAETLVDTVTLEPEDVKWLDTPTKRPWLAGLVKDRMCALLDVDAMISLLDKGIDVHQE